MKLYVAGPMTGLPENNYPAFRASAAWLTELGYEVADPSTNPGPADGDTWHEWLKQGIRQLLECQGVALLNGWEASVGARLEVQVAATCGLLVKPVDQWIERARSIASARFQWGPIR